MNYQCPHCFVELNPDRAEVARLTAKLNHADTTLHLCASAAGNPDAAAGCRIVIATVREWAEGEKP